ncbi:beta-N-acetylhexosaminidase [Paramicrobacterium humi]|uniref:beta-N-acetylhexosaminidase n=1 Tax=Paramicrobacterium humi TaxID=640635 RepID=A0A1H4NIP0_9MICO|nr:glycoside hydrolase family 3 N-terminal domain-containing protein [Microbacterium humi]SEB95099.1 beta-N-acetylhexosaminidase [Microbacterium humi]
MVSARALVRFAAVTAAVLSLSGCAPAVLPTTATPSATMTSSPTPSPTPDPIAGMSLRQKVAQLFMVGTHVGSADATALAAVRDDGVGGVFLHGPAPESIDAVAQLVGRFTQADSSKLPLWVATDQEGGQVQVLHGSGFDAIPSALEQGRLSPADLRRNAAQWGAQLKRAGVTMNLAPVADIVPAGSAGSNPPIGALEREYGGDEQSVAAGAGAFAEGMRTAGIIPTLKHFPGLGHVTTNTDFASGVTDDVVSASSPDVDVYRTLLGEGPAVVMMSTAIYAKIDKSAPAAFSPAVVSVLRDDVGFGGVVMTDDLSAATQVSAWSPAQRAILAIEAGVDLVLISSTPSIYPEMRDAVLQRATDDPAFAHKVDAAARRIAQAKAG